MNVHSIRDEKKLFMCVRPYPKGVFCALNLARIVARAKKDQERTSIMAAICWVWQMYHASRGPSRKVEGPLGIMDNQRRRKHGMRVKSDARGDQSHVSSLARMALTRAHVFSIALLEKEKLASKLSIGILHEICSGANGDRSEPREDLFAART